MTGPDEPRDPMSQADGALVVDAEAGRQALAQLRDELPRPLFRARLRREFAAGTLRSPVSRVTPAIEPQPVTAIPARPRVVRPTPSRWMILAVRSAIAAGLVVVVSSIVGGLNAGPPWRVTATSGEGVAVVDNRPIPVNHTADLEAALHPGARVRIPLGCEIGIRSAGAMTIRMTSDTDSDVPGIPGRWFGRNVTGEIRSGEWRIVTDPRFAGARLAIGTPAAHVEVTGTTLAVICEPPGTCVCVYEGRVRVGRDRRSMVEIEEGRRRFVFVDRSREMESDVMRPNEATELGHLHDEAMNDLQIGR